MELLRLPLSQLKPDLFFEHRCVAHTDDNSAYDIWFRDERHERRTYNIAVQIERFGSSYFHSKDLCEIMGSLGPLPPSPFG